MWGRLLSIAKTCASLCESYFDAAALICCRNTFLAWHEILICINTIDKLMSTKQQTASSTLSFCGSLCSQECSGLHSIMCYQKVISASSSDCRLVDPAQYSQWKYSSWVSVGAQSLLSLAAGYFITTDRDLNCWDSPGRLTYSWQKTTISLIKMK